MIPSRGHGPRRVELSEAVPSPQRWADLPNAPARLPGPAIPIAVVPDEDQDPARDPAVCAELDARRP